MSLITRCTACGTSFKVVPDQLKIGDGWVRCGQCNTVFDASAQLLELQATPEPAPESEPEPEPEPGPGPETLLSETESRLARSDELEALLADPAPAVPVVLTIDMAPDESADVNAAEPVAAASVPASSPQDHATPASIPVAGSDADHLAPPVPGPVQTGETDEAPSPLLLQTATQDAPLEMDAGLEPAPDLGGTVPGVTTAPAPAASPELGDLSFVRQAERKAFWRRPLVRVLLWLSTLVLLVLLGLQLAVQQRDALAAHFPRLQPALELLCERWGCTIAPRQHIASIAIDSSSFNRAKGDVYQLSLTLKSSASTELATPAIELTLTDVQDQPILRRVLQPSELGLAPVLAPRGELSASAPVSIALEQGTARVAGYRLLAFYP